MAEADLDTGQPADALEKMQRAASRLSAHNRVASPGNGQRFNNALNLPLYRSGLLVRASAAWQLEQRRTGSQPSYADEGFAAAQIATQSKAAAAITQMAARFSASDDALGQLVRQAQDLSYRWQALDRQLTSQFAERATDANARREMRTELDQIGRELAGLDKRIVAEFPQYAELVQPSTLKIADVQKLLGANEAVLTFLVGSAETYVWAIASDRTAWQRLQLGERAIAEKVARLRKGIEVPQFQKGLRGATGELFDLALAYELYSDLIAPVEEALEGKRNLLIVPSGPLTSLPFHLLVTEPPAKPITALDQIPEYRNAQWIIGRFAISLLPSVVNLKALRGFSKIEQASKPLVGFGNPKFRQNESETEANASQEKVASAGKTRAYASYFHGARPDLMVLRQGLAPLPETANELRVVAKRLGAPESDIHLGVAASEATVKSMDLRPYRVVYFATHGLVAGEVDGLAEPALALSLPNEQTALDDGLLTASEVAQLKLNADWVVLSACNTAAGDKPGAEALSGLARAFFYAGARALLVSHWRVQSDAAARLTASTFETLQKDQSIGRAEALRRAMLAMIEDTTNPWNAYPDFWGAFSVVGENAR
jgi:CHAT domain-containing protein